LLPYLIGLAGVSVWIVFGSIHRDQHSDSILNVLISLQRWTPFVWEQDRFGMLVPLLALPIRNPLENMLFQAFLSTFAGLATFTLLARFAFRDATYPLVGTIGAASLLALTPPYYRFEYLVDTSYGTSMALALWALILVEPRARGRNWASLTAALFLMTLAHWVNCVTAYYLGPIVLLRSLSDFRWAGLILSITRKRPVRARPDPKELVHWIAWISRQPIEPVINRLKILAVKLWQFEWFRALVVLAVGFEFGQLFISLCPYQPTTYSSLPVGSWPGGWWELLRTNRDALGQPLWVGLMAIELALGIVGLALSGRWRSLDAWWAAGLLIGTAVALWLLLGTRTWVMINAYAFRYLFTSALLVQTAVAGLAIASFGSWAPTWRRSRAGLAVLATLVLLGGSAWSYGLPSMAGVRRDIDRQCGALTDDILAGHCTCLAGDYWKVWISVFHVNLVLYEKGSLRPFWGLTFRAGPTVALWSHEPFERCLAAVPNSDEHGEHWLESYAMPRFERIEIRPTIRVYRPIPVSRRSP
jgi:hypothetical protein